MEEANSNERRQMGYKGRQRPDSRSPPSRSRSPREREREDRRDRSSRHEQSGHGYQSRHGDADSRRHHRRTRSRSPTQHRSHHQRHRSPRSQQPGATVNLPLGARALTKSDFRAFRPLLAYYLDLQKGKNLSRMDEREAKGRWKSFLRKWNEGQLSEGWYDPEMFVSATERLRDMSPEPEPVSSRRGERSQEHDDEDDAEPRGSNDEEDDDDMGPALPPTARASGQRSGPGIPNLDELAARREERSEEAQALREQEIEDLRYARKQDRKLQKERLEELVPRADPGSRERRLEKRAAVNEKMQGFRDKSPGGDAAVGDGDLMGGGDGIADLKRQRAENERRKTEREIRREEIARAKAEEREERLREWREREEGTMKALKELAKQRFG